MYTKITNVDRVAYSYEYPYLPTIRTKVLVAKPRSRTSIAYDYDYEYFEDRNLEDIRTKTRKSSHA